ncbi:MAG: hypothetical protein SCARUB_03777 [Candidatus Scalindua rubra]|uniref:Uncharacterized protein n=1 Tax=Candidatus Scalindua rubra TaxID=1872076 RepID=A0A1E3X689_9BACT|nr:MAG: hypothetical protein SCARUB_03777 [Candidatus Scalindua rubra]
MTELRETIEIIDVVSEPELTLCLIINPRFLPGLDPRNWRGPLDIDVERLVTPQEGIIIGTAPILLLCDQDMQEIITFRGFRILVPPEHEQIFLQILM